MKFIPVILGSFLLLLLACGKDKFETKPRLEIKDYNATEIFSGTELRITINFFDKEGDLNGSPFTAIRVRQNSFPPSPGKDKADTLDNYVLPDFPQKDNGEITIAFPHDFLSESERINDTLVFRFAVTDKAGNHSDTITSNQIVVHNEP